ncbi:MAG TPA: hypothetical protein HPP77_05340 [Candidatus Hydrogenedentes bacterium]|nr:hypothetical protein [Candidatus Hydrogenedentota bacterium]HIJ72751.1 hypothetical protein [Candidatus Hydrogenedentota bacterium]
MPTPDPRDIYPDYLTDQNLMVCPSDSGSFAVYVQTGTMPDWDDAKEAVANVDNATITNNCVMAHLAVPRSYIYLPYTAQTPTEGQNAFQCWKKGGDQFAIVVWYAVKLGFPVLYPEDAARIDYFYPGNNPPGPDGLGTDCPYLDLDLLVAGFPGGDGVMFLPHGFREDESKLNLAIPFGLIPVDALDASSNANLAIRGWTGTCASGSHCWDPQIQCEIADPKIRFVKEGIERFFITDINNPAASNKGQSRVAVMWDAWTQTIASFDPTIPDDGVLGRGDWDGLVVFNHLPGGGNVLFMDGHVEFIRYTKTPIATTPDMATEGGRYPLYNEPYGAWGGGDKFSSDISQHVF